MNPSSIIAIQIAGFISANFQSAEIVDQNDEIIWTEPVMPVSSVITLLKMIGQPEPDFAGWAEKMTSNKQKAQKRKRLLLASKIQAAMKGQGVTQADIANMVNKYPSQINRFLSGENITVDTIIMFENCLNIKLLDLS